MLPAPPGSTADLARQRLLQTLKNPPACLTQNLARASMAEKTQADVSLRVAFFEDLKILAEAGDTGSLGAFVDSGALGRDTLNQVNGGRWLSDVFRAANHSALLFLTQRWTLPMLLSASADACGGALEGSRHHAWVAQECLAICCQRASGLEELLLACERGLELSASRQMSSSERASDQLQMAAPYLEPSEFARLLRVSVATLASRDRAFLPTFASRLGHDLSERLAEAQGPLAASRLTRSCALLLNWCQGIDLSGPGERGRLLGLLSPYTRYPELAEPIAQLTLRFGSAEGFLFEDATFGRLENPILPGIHPNSIARCLLAAQMTGRSLGPVDQAFFNHSPETADALISQGLAFRPAEFERLCRALLSDEVPLGEKWKPACQQALALCEAWQIQRSSPRLAPARDRPLSAKPAPRASL